jgi:hypothetical protein
MFVREVEQQIRCVRLILAATLPSEHFIGSKRRIWGGSNAKQRFFGLHDS